MAKKQFRFYSIIFWVLLSGRLVYGQFSPGALSKYHEHLEGNTNCTQCHELRKKELSNGCVDCHYPLKERMDAKKGFHIDKLNECGECHSDHNGKDFELVYWPKDIKKFNHEETGYTLTGKHKKLECRKCHTSEQIKAPSIIKWAKENSQFPVLDRTFLGLETTCNSCHENIHQEAISQDCQTCHNSSGWKLAIDNFDHKRARFQLTGAHQKVDCMKCHPALPDPSQKGWKLTEIAFENCSNCHKDYHEGSFGTTCEACHTTVDWKKNLKPFDHAKTKYPLKGKHAEVQCNDCHQKIFAGGLPKFNRCDQCHEDKHFGQFTSRKDGGDCTPCHNVNGFKPSKFTFSMHQLARLTLEGAHLAVPCNKCHEPFQPKKGVRTTRFTWDNYTCNVCHEDIHRNQFSRLYNNDCKKCHITDLFSNTIFDHQTSSFPLDGRHKSVKCNDCHQSEMDSKGQFIRYYPTQHKCSDCHTFTGEIR